MFSKLLELKTVSQFLENFAEVILQRVRKEYTVMPRFMFHQPSDYNLLSFPIKEIKGE
jgi:hypothetical protein